MPRVARLEASRRTRIPSLSRQALGLGFEAQTEKPSYDGFVANTSRYTLYLCAYKHLCLYKSQNYPQFGMEEYKTMSHTNYVVSTQ
jgi:hypothetical protein